MKIRFLIVAKEQDQADWYQEMLTAICRLRDREAEFEKIVTSSGFVSKDKGKDFQVIFFLSLDFMDSARSMRREHPGAEIFLLTAYGRILWVLDKFWVTPEFLDKMIFFSQPKPILHKEKNMALNFLITKCQLYLDLAEPCERLIGESLSEPLPVDGVIGSWRNPTHVVLDLDESRWMIPFDELSDKLVQADKLEPSEVWLDYTGSDTNFLRAALNWWKASEASLQKAISERR